MIGWFVVAARAQVFAGDALSHVAFVGAIAAAAVGVDERVGLFVLTLALAGAMGVLGRRAQADDVTIGITFAWILGIGVLLLAVLATSAGGASGITTANTLFGSIYSLSAGAAVIAAAVALAVTGVRPGRRRPLLLSTLDPELAALRGIPVRLLGLGFLAALAIVTAESTQAVGALLLLGLIAAPAGAARAADLAAATRHRHLGGGRRRRDVGRAGAQLRDQRAAAEQGHHRPGGGAPTPRAGDLVGASDPPGRLRGESAPAEPGDPRSGGHAQAGVVARAAAGTPGSGEVSPPAGDEAHIRRNRTAPGRDAGRDTARGCHRRALGRFAWNGANSTCTGAYVPARQLFVRATLRIG